jgi:EAL domain-containing protein (putative c-di-GMP-specific phosphodiesterase class I)
MLAQALDIDGVAQGVETVSQLTQIKSLNCEFG